MARLFITPKEINFINDLMKECIKDVMGMKIYLYLISDIKTKIHDVYRESPEKIFTSEPIELNALVSYQPPDVSTNQFGLEQYASIEVHVQSRDLIDRGIEVQEGDFFSFGPKLFEITSKVATSLIYGEVEYLGGVKLTGKQSRESNMLTKIFGPTWEGYSDKDSVQNVFVQQRGFEQTQEGKTGDVRELVRKGILEKPLSGPQEVSPRGDSTSTQSAFYDDK